MQKNVSPTEKKAPAKNPSRRDVNDPTRKPSETPRKPSEMSADQPREVPRQPLPTERDRERAENEGMIAQPPPEETSKPKNEGVEGEGSYSATHRYNEGVKHSIERGDTDRLASEAERAVVGPEGQALREAEEAAKHGKNPVKKSA